MAARRGKSLKQGAPPVDKRLWWHAAGGPFSSKAWCLAILQLKAAHLPGTRRRRRRVAPGLAHYPIAVHLAAEPCASTNARALSVAPSADCWPCVCLAPAVADGAQGRAFAMFDGGVRTRPLPGGNDLAIPHRVLATGSRKTTMCRPASLRGAAHRRGSRADGARAPAAQKPVLRRSHRVLAETAPRFPACTHTPSPKRSVP